MLRFAASLGRSFPVPDAWRTALPPETVVCRCEEVTAAQILAAARRYGAGDARTMKLLARTGMGWCQGRICGYATEELVAHHAGVAPVHRPAGIPVAFPVPLGDLGGALPR
jgi:NADP-dependent aldehyde dehydrogenase